MSEHRLSEHAAHAEILATGERDWLVNGQRLTEAPNGWTGSVQLPTQTVSAPSEREAIERFADYHATDPGLCTAAPVCGSLPNAFPRLGER